MAEQETRLVLEVGLSEALARRLKRLFEDAPHDAKEEAMLLDEAWGEIHAAYENGAARLYRFERPTQSAVFVGVEGGLADYTAFGPVRVALVDWDAIRDACDDEEALERIAEYREEIAASRSRRCWRSLRGSALQVGPGERQRWRR